LDFFLKHLIAEVAAKGWRTPRTAWLISLCTSSSIFVTLQLDPRGILGIFSVPAIKLLEWCVIVSLLVSCAFGAYMYLIALYQRNTTTVPPFLRINWFVYNALFTVLHFALSLTATILENKFWFGIDGIALVFHEASHILVLNVCIFKLSRYLHHLTQERSSLGAVDANFSSALRKMLYVRIGSIIFAIIVFVYQIFTSDGILDRVSKPYSPFTPYDNTIFVFSSILGFLLVALLHTLLLYVLRRPQAKGSERTSERTPSKKELSTKEISSSSSSRPSVV